MFVTKDINVLSCSTTFEMIFGELFWCDGIVLDERSAERGESSGFNDK